MEHSHLNTPFTQVFYSCVDTHLKETENRFFDR